MTSKINSTAFAVIKDYDAYNESRAETVEVDLFKVGSNPVRINVADCVGDRTAFRATIADKVATLGRTRHAFSWAVSKVLYGVLQETYKTRAPWKVTECLTAFADKHFSRDEINRMCVYFELAGLDMQFPKGKYGLPVCEAIRDIGQQADVFNKMKTVNVFDMKLKGRDAGEARQRAEKDLPKDPAKRVRGALNRAAATARKDSEAAEDQESKKMFAREAALATAAKEILAFLAHCDDPHAVSVEFKAWFESSHAKELEAKNKTEQANMIKAGKA